jgi:hypothetical protein
MTFQDVFSTETSGLAGVSRPGVVRLRDGDLLELGIGAVRKGIEGAELRMLAYAGRSEVSDGSSWAVCFATTDATRASRRTRSSPNSAGAKPESA